MRISGQELAGVGTQNEGAPHTVEETEGRVMCPRGLSQEDPQPGGSALLGTVLLHVDLEWVQLEKYRVSIVEINCPAR